MPSSGRSNAISVIPSARRLITSLRDVGYDFVHAVADLVDNSVTAGASRVEVTLRFQGHDTWLRIADDGGGMSGETLTEAMRYGSERDYEEEDLGRFGLGLKTASMSQARRLLVASREDGKARIDVRALDLDHIEKTDRWEVLDLPQSECPEDLLLPLRHGHGTVVLWEALDRVMNYKDPRSEFARTGILNLTEKLDFHLGMVFHRFISGEATRRGKLTITVNGTRVEPWDPFARNEAATKALPQQIFELPLRKGTGRVKFQAFILPPKDRFSSLTEFERLGGPRRWNRQQGFYVYRADRMIQSGGWSYMRTADEHTKLARACLDFSPKLDEVFELNVSKVRVILPSELRSQLEGPVEALIRQAKQAYDPKARDKERPRGDGSGARGHGPAPGVGVADEPRTTGAVHPHRIRNVLDDAARSTDGRAALERIKTFVRRIYPEVARALGW
jgi:hypothetical protein